MQAPLTQFPFVAGAYAARSLNFDAQRTVNLYPELSGSGNSKSIAMLLGCPGTRSWDQVIAGAGPIRGMLPFSSTKMFAVSGSLAMYFDTTGTAFYMSPAVPIVGSGPVSMASNGIVVMLVTGAGKPGYIIDPVANTVTQITDPDFVGADRVDFIGGYFIWNKPGTQQYQISGLYSTTIDPLDFASAEAAPDLLVSLNVSFKEAWLYGETTTEVHILSGNADFPIEPIQGAVIEQGCAAAFSVAKMTDGSGTGTNIWLSRNATGQGMFVKSVGYQAVRISDHALEYAIQSYSRIDDAIAYTYQQEGHSFYVCSFPTANKTWAYDTSTELWHERAWRDPATGALGRHRSNCYAFFAGKHLVGDYSVARIYYFDLDTYGDRMDSGSFEAMPAIRQCPHLGNGSNDWQIFDELWIDMETGVGLNANFPFTSVGKDPQLILEWSDDGGHTFPNSRLVPIGKIGERKVRAVARRLGKSRDRVFRVTITDPVKRCFIAAGARVRAA
jgi:hypothetical protein